MKEELYRLDEPNGLPRKVTQTVLKQTALLAVENGWKADTVAGVLNISRRTLFRWLAQQRHASSSQD